MAQENVRMCSEVVRKDLIRYLPNLLAFAMSLRRNRQDADDLLQETMLKAWSNIDTFTEGTNLRAWLFTIMRNTHNTQYRKSEKERMNEYLGDASEVGVPPRQMSTAEARDILKALQKLDHHQRETLLLVAAQGFNYEEAAKIVDCPVGTIKSRLNRARKRLAKVLAMRSLHDVYSPES
jgi:RNA polymerase sigma-70 factor (ECF subfamily)